jgi:hypothetical protein
VTIAAYVALFGWVPAILVFFVLMPIRRAATVAVIGAWLLLPPYAIPISNFPDYSRNTAATIGMILGTLFFGFDRILAFRPRWFDLPMLGWCFWGIASSLHNDLGVYDGLSDALNQALYWGMPYLLGRLYFSNHDGVRDFTVAMTIGGLAYVLPCIWEMRMSPHLLQDIYGIAHWQGTKFGGFRPHVFFRTGLECGMWMTAASLTAWWLWRCAVLTRLGQFSFGKVVLPILLITTILCRATGALVLLAGGMVMLWASTRFKTRLLLMALVLFGPLYVCVRVQNLWSGAQLVQVARAVFGDERAQSLQDRFHYEDLLITKAVQQPVYGWGGWNRSAVYFDENYRDFDHQVPVDGLWIATFGSKGLVGLSLLYLAMELPVMLFLWRFPARLWHRPQMAPVTLAATLLGLYMIDCISNGFVNIIYVTLAGALISIMPDQLEVGPLDRRRAGAASHSEGRRHRGAAIAPLGGTSEIGLADQCYRLGRTSKDQGLFNEAQVAWQRALDILTSLTARSPASPDLQRRWCDCANDLAWLLLNHPDSAARNPASALALSSQVVRRSSDCGGYWNTLGVAYFRAGDFKAAVTALGRAMVLSGGGTPFDHIFLAMAHARLGDRELARRWLAQAMVRKDQEYPAHPELGRFCDEAASILAAVPQTASTAHR